MFLVYSNPFTTQNSDCLSSANFHQAFSDSSLFCSSSNFSESALCITCSPSSSASSNKFAIGNPLSHMSSSLSSDSNKLSLPHASFSCLILSDVILDFSSLVSSLFFPFRYFLRLLSHLHQHLLPLRLVPFVLSVRALSHSLALPLHA